MKKQIHIALVVGITVGLLAACAPAETPTSARTQAPGATKTVPPAATSIPTKVLRVGMVWPLTGPSARAGEELRDATLMAFEEAAYAIGDYKVELVTVDDESDPEKGSLAYEEAVTRDGIDVALGTWNSSVSVACMEVVAKHKIPHFFGFGGTPVVNEKYESDPEKYGYWMGKWGVVPGTWSTVYTLVIEDAIRRGIWDPGEKRAAMYGDDTDWGRSFAEAVSGHLQDEGWEIMTQEFFNPGETDFYPLITRLKSMDVELVAGTISSGPLVAGFTKQAKEQQLDSLLVADGLGRISEWYEMTGDASDYILDGTPVWGGENASVFIDAFSTKFGYEPATRVGGLAYDAAHCFIALCEETLKEYGELSSESLYEFGREKVMTGQWSCSENTTVMKRYRYTADTFPDLEFGPGGYIFAVFQYLQGEGRIVYPADMKEADLALPARMKQ